MQTVILDKDCDGPLFGPFHSVDIAPTNADDECAVTSAANTNLMRSEEII